MVAVVAGDAGAAAASCSGGSESCDAGPAAIGLGVGLGMWIYSMATAPGDARAWNAQHVVASAPAVAPHLARSAGRTQLGLAAAW